MLSTLALAAAIASAPIAPPAKVHLDVTPAELAVIADALADKPYRRPGR